MHNINVQNYHSFWSYDKNCLSLNPKYDICFMFGGGGPGGLLCRTLGCQNFRDVNPHHRADNITREKQPPVFNIWATLLKQKFIIGYSGGPGWPFNNQTISIYI